LIDGMALVFRAYHALSRSGLKSALGEPTGAVFGFTNIITTLLEKENPSAIAVAFDVQQPTFRHKIYPEYKANRDAFPEELVPQLARIKSLIDYLGIPQIELPGYEADDIIGTLAKAASRKGIEVACVTSDKDFYQLVDDNIKILKPTQKSAEDFEIIDYSGVNKKFGVLPEQVIDVLALIGDTSDNIKGVAGIGEKTAIPLIQKYGSLTGLYEHLPEISSLTTRKKLEADRSSAFLALKLVTIDIDVPLNIELSDLSLKMPNYEELDKLFAELGFNSLRLRWKEKALKAKFAAGEAVQVVSVEEDKEPERISEVKHEYILVDSLLKFSEMMEELWKASLLAVDTETSSLDRTSCEIVGISLSVQEGKAYYVPLSSENVIDSDISSSNEPDKPLQSSLFDSIAKLEIRQPIELFATEKKSLSNTEPEDFTRHSRIIKFLKPLLESPDIGKCGQNIKFDAFILRRYGINLSPIVFDSMVASYLLNPDERHNLEAISQKWLDYTPIPISALIGEKKSTQKSMKELPPEDISDYACEDADLALKLRNRLNAELEKEKLEKLAREIEFPLIEVLTEMELNGAAIDTIALKDIGDRISKQTTELAKQIYAEAGEQFNIDSTKQLAFILFDRMNIPALKKNKTGYSTDISVLEQLAPDYKIASLVVEYRQLQKLLNTYIEALPKLISKQTNRIHTTFNQTIASTGRLSSTDPNLQNIPIRTELGKQIRRAFVPQKPYECLLSADYSQVELRIMAYFCRDTNLINAFREGKDIHSATAAILYDCSIDSVTQDMRRTAKTVNFGIMYGLGSFGLSQRLGISRGEASEIINNYFAKYPGIRAYIDDTINEARRSGYTTTLCGRRRFFANINSKNHNLRAADERAAINMPIQGTAADMMKIAMIDVHKELKRKAMKSMMIIQVHDELVFEVYPGELETLKQIVTEKMESALSLGDVPVKIDIGVGSNWFEAH